MFGDITNLIGAIWAGLVPTVIALAIYFCFADTVLIAQCLYYRRTKERKPLVTQADPVEDDPNRPLLNSPEPVNLRLPGSRRNSSLSHKRRDPVIGETDQSANLGNGNNGTKWVRNTLSVVAVCLVGTAAWAIAWQVGAWRPVEIDAIDDGSTREPVGALALGYVSALCYLGYVSLVQQLQLSLTLDV